MTTFATIEATKGLVRAALDRYYETDKRSIVYRDPETQRILYALYAANEVLFEYLILLARREHDERLSRANAPDALDAPLRRPMSALWQRRLERRSLGL
jgi:hypothetical protein